MANRGTLVLSIDDVDLLLDLIPAPERDEREQITTLRTKVSESKRDDARTCRKRPTDRRGTRRKLQELRLKLLEGAVNA